MLLVKQKHEFDCTELSSIKDHLNEHGFAVVKEVINDYILDALKTATLRETKNSSISEGWGSQTCMNFVEVAPEALLLLDHAPYMNVIKHLHGTDELCFHRSACIARKPGKGIVHWHTDQSKLGPNEPPKIANDVLNSQYFDYDGISAWHYLTGSRPSHGGIYVIEGSHKPSWKIPEGFKATACQRSFYRIGEKETPYTNFDVPGAIAVIADPKDLILFCGNTYHAANSNQESEVRLSCGSGLRPKRVKVKAPWAWPESAHAFKANLSPKFQSYLEGYTSIKPDWKAN